ncbi:MAG: DUF420 domain-containing protein [Candidatus Fervidibacter sp.]|uniref:DUF420 domain-containing protein n=1 Tax=Candidatus Fervidibacter sp. TaxID=3100871 RepID=UPI00404B9C94
MRRNLDLKFLPTLNATLNLISAVSSIAGYISIRRGNASTHKACMLFAFIASTTFFISYTVYHANVGATRFSGTGLIRPIYFTILVSHTVLAALIVPTVIITLFRAFKGDFSRHKAIARWTFPLWLCVSLTDILIYLMVYHFLPSR